MPKPNMSLRRIFRINCGVCGNRINGIGAYCDACNVFLHGANCDRLHTEQHMTYFDMNKPNDREKIEQLIKKAKVIMNAS
jgi:hypothetical protein